ncbi:MAG: Acetyl-coenzyme A carboxylase carboxyl transferase subunit alpha [Alphaproteobacteria bacterium ADurb.Bin438]|nr:MAG: Acetyl-coenzyme A carboxylase carboxyl transferase subunit alpha [Alphaproteobacteria bacterium ADurb.Bin438]
MEQENTYLDFEKNIAELESKIHGLKHLTDGHDINIAEEITNLENKLHKQVISLYSKLSPWQKAQVARHPNRPHCVHYVEALFTDFTPLAGDRLFGEDAAVITGIARFQGRSVAIIGQEKGNDIKSRVKHNFGMAKPEGYRKAQRIMDLANRFGLPIITFVDTAGAYPGVDAEERGQAEAIAQSMYKSFDLTVPVISIVIGEGGSGGAIAIATANTIVMLEHSIYSIISPEGCASILWRDPQKVQVAADALKLTAQDLKKFNIIDEIIPEPLGGAHRDPKLMIKRVGEELRKQLEIFDNISPEALKLARVEKFKKITREY